MKKMYFNNQKDWEKVYAVFCRTDEISGRVIELKEKNPDGYYEVDFENDSFDLIYFSGGIGQKTKKVHPGELSLCIEHKFNENKGEDLTYLVSRKDSEIGKVENYIISDEENLAYREDKSKKISVFVPEHYNGETSYDVLYFFDAQNLFSNSGKYTDNGDPYGSWQLDIVLDEIYRQYGKRIIVVGIDNSDEYRTRELFMDPSEFGKLAPLAKAIPNDDFSKGYLDNLSTFMVTTLHTFIKSRYNINEDNIGIGGSSMGGIASFYCGIKELGFYKYIISYSPAFGLYEEKAFDNYFKTKNFRDNKSILPKIHIYCGGGDMLENMLLYSAKDMIWYLYKNGYNKELVYETFAPKKPHNEESWRLVLPESFSYLLDL